MPALCSEPESHQERVTGAGCGAPGPEGLQTPGMAWKWVQHAACPESQSAERRTWTWESIQHAVMSWRFVLPSQKRW